MIDFFDTEQGHSQVLTCTLLVYGEETEVTFDTSVLVPKLKEGDPIVLEMLEEADSVNMQLSSFVEQQTALLNETKTKAKSMYNTFTLYYGSLGKSLLARAIGFPATDKSTPTLSYLKSITEHAAEKGLQIKGVKSADSYDHTDRIILDGKEYKKVLEKQELHTANLRKLKSILEQRKSMMMNVRSLNTNFRILTSN